jgi:hypothetical protein
MLTHGSRHAVTALVLLLAGCEVREEPDPDSSVADSGSEPGDSGQDAGGGSFSLPPASSVCADLSASGTSSIEAMGIADVASTIAGDEYGVAHIAVGGDGDQHLYLSRVSIEGAQIGTSIDVTTFGDPAAAGVAIATDGERYLVCGGAYGTELRCASVPVGGGAVTMGAAIGGGSLPSLAFGAGGFMLAYLTATGVSVQPLDRDASALGDPRPIANGTGRARIAATEDGYVVGFARGTAVTAQLLDGAGAPAGAPIPLGTARSMTDVAISFSDRVGAIFIDDEGEARFALEGSAPIAISEEAMSYGDVAIARASNGFLASWSDFNGFIGIAAIGQDGARIGTSVSVSTEWNDNPHALVASEDRFLLATSFSFASSPIALRSIACP